MTCELIDVTPCSTDQLRFQFDASLGMPCGGTLPLHSSCVLQHWLQCELLLLLKDKDIYVMIQALS